MNSMIRKSTAWLAAAILLLCNAGGIAQTATEAEEINVPVIDGMKTFEIPDNEAMAFVRDMMCGWNLGNTFDAYSDYTTFVRGLILDNWYGSRTEFEKIWVGAITTEELIDAVCKAGFKTIRIPVSWHNHADPENEYRIDAEWLARVREVAEWALEREMYVIVNVHHDNDVQFFYPDREHLEQSKVYLSAIWKQMAEAFADCDEHLILEAMNEPRLVGTDNEWYWTEDSPACLEAAECINELNQLFVDTVRATGGNNALRYLSVPAYDAAPWYAVHETFRLPKDTADNRIIVAAHAYSPYDFALNVNSTDITFNLDTEPEKKAEISGFLGSLYDRFVSQGIPVVMDEFGALDKDGNTQARVNFTAYYVAAASARGITCVWWDNNLFKGEGERFGLIDRKTVSWTYPEIVQAIMQNCQYHR